MTDDSEAAKKAKQSRVGKSNVARSKSHERRVAGLLTDWSDTEFRRRRNEGRDFRTVAVDAVADVIPVLSDFRFSVEAKCGAKFSLDALMASPFTALFTEWWHQATFDAKLLTETRGKTYLPMLFFKPHPNHDWVAISRDGLAFLQPNFDQLSGPGVSAASHFLSQVAAGNQAELWFPYLSFDAYDWLGPIPGNVSHTKKAKNKRIVHLQLPPVIMCRWRTFAANVQPGPMFYRLEPKIPEEKDGVRPM